MHKLTTYDILLNSYMYIINYNFNFQWKIPSKDYHMNLSLL